MQNGSKFFTWDGLRDGSLLKHTLAILTINQHVFPSFYYQVFFVIHLHAGPVINTLPPIMDPDPLLTCDLMDGRDAFLTLARDKHWEFSSLRRCKWSTMCMLVELHNQGQDRFVYTCNECKHHVETRWHCTVCEVGNSGTLQICFDIYICISSQFN